MRPPIRHIRLPLVASVTVLALGGCKPPSGNTDQSEGVTRDPSGIVIPVPLPKRDAAAANKIILCLPNGADPHQRVQANLLADMLRAAEGYELGFTDARGSAESQAGQLRALAAAKPKAVMILPVDSAAVKEEIAALKKAGTFVIGLDASLNDGTCDTVVFCNQKKIGSMAGDIIVSALKRRAADNGTAEITGRVVQIQGDENHPYCRARNEGFLAALKAQPGIVLVHDAPANWNKANAALRFKEALNLQKNIDTVYAHNDMMARGISEASLEKNVRESLLIVGTDGITGPGAGLEMLRRSEIDATIHQPLLVDFAWRIIEKMAKDPAFKPKAAYEIEPIAFTPKNMDERLAAGLPVPPL